MGFPRVDLFNRTFERWTVIGPAPTIDTYPRWWCQCRCGTIRQVRAGNLLSGASLSCGCLQKEAARKNLLTHGRTGSSEYSIWASMRQRCFDQHCKAYPNYGGRGITVCERWRDSFQAFYAEMGPRPSTNHSIERRDNDGPYSPENCYWGTRIEQARNARNNHRITIGEHTACLAEWFEILGIKPITYYKRRKKGWTIEDSLTKPVNLLMSHKKPL
jgi:hypothetical protein